MISALLAVALPALAMASAPTTKDLWAMHERYLDTRHVDPAVCADYAKAYNAATVGTSDDERSIDDTTVLPALLDPKACR